MSELPPLLWAAGLRLTLHTGRGPLRIVDGVDFAIRPGEFYALIGESGSGKTMIARAILRLFAPGRLTIDGDLRFADIDLATAPEPVLRGLRGGRIGMIFQDPMSALDPIMTIRGQLEDAMAAHGNRAGAALWRQRLADLGLPAPAHTGTLYPHQLSGGMRQRVMIAMTLLNNPALLIADEPTTALDVTVAQQIMDILAGLRRDGLAVLFISHDLALVHRHADRIGVLYGGVLMEDGPAPALIAAPAHPYTAALLACIPRARAPGTRQAGIDGLVPAPGDWPPGCRFAARCAHRRPDCTEAPIPLTAVAPGRRVRCLHPL